MHYIEKTKILRILQIMQIMKFCWLDKDDIKISKNVTQL